MAADERKERNPADPGRAWARYEPDAARPWNLARAGHLFRRAAFGASWGTLQRALEEGPQRSVDRLLRPDGDLAAFEREMDACEAPAADSDSADGLRAWWIHRMLRAPHPLLERMTLFWHDFFGVSNVRVKSAGLLRRHAQLLRRHALGSFDDLLADLSRDPALLVNLEAAANRKARPSEFFARALLETVLGEGRFGGEDVRGVARAFTGWFVIRGEIRLIERERDGGTKRILGKEGAFGAEDAARMLAREPAAARKVVRRLFRALVSETREPPEDLLAPLAESFGRDRDIGRLAETVLRSDLFFSGEAYRQRVKSPVEFGLGIAKAFEAAVPAAILGRDLAKLGQDLFRPPTVRGWEGGPAWIHWLTAVGRANLVAALLSGEGPYAGKIDPLAAARKHGRETAGSAEEFLIDLLLQGDVDVESRKVLQEGSGGPGGPPLDGDAQRFRRFVHLVATLPEYQLS